jgi:hypothetical protein
MSVSYKSFHSGFSAWINRSFHRYVAQGILRGDWAGGAAELFGRFGE